MEDFVRSETLPYQPGCRTDYGNPILECLADQVNHDPFYMGKAPDFNRSNIILNFFRRCLNNSKSNIYTSFDILQKIINEIDDIWEIDNDWTTKDEWIDWIQLKTVPEQFQKMKPKLNNPDPRVTFRAYEILLLNLASKCLRRRIKLISLIGGDEITIPEENDEAKSMIFPPLTYHLLCYNKVITENVYLSIFPNNS